MRQSVPVFIPPGADTGTFGFIPTMGFIAFMGIFMFMFIFMFMDVTGFMAFMGFIAPMVFMFIIIGCPMGAIPYDGFTPPIIGFIPIAPIGILLGPAAPMAGFGALPAPALGADDIVMGMAMDIGIDMDMDIGMEESDMGFTPC